MRCWFPSICAALLSGVLLFSEFPAAAAQEVKTLPTPKEILNPPAVPPYFEPAPAGRFELHQKGSLASMPAGIVRYFAFWKLDRFTGQVQTCQIVSQSKSLKCWNWTGIRTYPNSTSVRFKFVVLDPPEMVPPTSPNPLWWERATGSFVFRYDLTNGKTAACGAKWVEEKPKDKCSPLTQN